MAEKITVVSPRSLNDAILLLQGQLQCVITFEDAPYEYEPRVVEIYPGGFRIPREREIEFTYKKEDKPIDIIRDLLKLYNDLDNTCSFVAQIDPIYEGVYHVYPTEFRNELGEYITYDSLLAKPITLSIQTGATKGETLETFCRLISTEEITVDYIGDDVNGTFLKTNFFNVLARSCLVSMMQEMTSHNGGEIFSFSIRQGPPSIRTKNVVVLYIYKIDPREYLGKSHWLYVESMRPLFSAINAINIRLYGSIVYEDQNYLCSCDVIRDTMGRARVPSGGKFVFGYNLHSDRLKTVQALINTYNSQHDACRYGVHESGEYLYIYPIEFRNVLGNKEPWEPLLNIQIEPKPPNISTAEYIIQILNELSEQRNIKITCDELSGGIEKVRPVPESCRTVAQVLNFVGEQISQNTLWELYYDPAVALYKLRVYTGTQ